MSAVRPRLPLALFLLAGAALTLAAGLMLFSTFMLYDDEGYVLFSLRNFALHGHLYDQVYSQYGPAPYLLYGALHALGLPFTHTAGRLLTLGIWSGAALLAAGMTWGATRSATGMLATLAGVFVYLWVMVSEPNHPGGLVVLGTAVLAALGHRWLAAGRWQAWAALAGAGSAFLLLTKINVGAFAALAAAALLLLHSRSDRLRRAAPWALAAGLAALPFLLMRPLLGEPWVRTYALLFALGGLPLAGAAALAAEPACGLRTWGAALLGGGAVALALVGAVLAAGTTPAGLAQGVILGPLAHPGHFSLVFPWPPAVRAAALASAAAFVVAIGYARGPRRPAADHAVAGLRLLAAGALALDLLRFPAASPDQAVFAYGLPCLWLMAWPLAGEDRGAVAARGWVALLLLGQWLHAFPVPGSQIAWGTFLALPLAALGAWSAAAWLRARHPGLAGLPGRGVAVALRLGLAALALTCGVQLGRIGRRYLGSRPLDLPGAEILRLPDSATALYRILVLNAVAHSDMVFSLPGMFSFNLWTGLPAPTLVNVTHWFSLVDVPDQEEIIRSLAAHPRACVIVQKDHVAFLRQRGLAPAGPLYDYIMAQYEPAFELDGFQFRVRRGRSIADLQTAELFQEKTGGPAPATGSYDTLLQLQLLLPPHEPATDFTISTMDDPGAAPLVLDGRNARIEATPIDLQGRAEGATTARSFPFTPGGPAQVSLYFNRGNRRFPLNQTLIVVHGAARAELALVRLRP